jgi:transposase
MEKNLIVAVDVSKGYGDFVVLDTNKEVKEPHFRLDDNQQGHQILTQQLLGWKKKYNVHRILLVAESTGGYEDNWLRIVNQARLSKFVEAHRLNAKVIYHEYQAQRRSSIDDGISAHTIGVHVAKNLEQFREKNDEESIDFKAARSLVRHIVSLSDEATAHKNALGKLLYQYLPSLEGLKPDGWPLYWLEMFIKYGSRSSIQRAASQGFKQLKLVPKGKAKQIYQALSQGIDMRQTPVMAVLAMQSKARQIKRLHEEIKRVEQILINQAPVKLKQVRLLESINGMGTRAAVLLLCFIEDVNRFGSAKQMAAFFGVQPRVKSSGDGAYRTKMSKQGNPLVRRELYLLAFRMLQTEPYLKAIYAKCRKKAMNHDAALGVLMHKLVRMIYGMLKNNQAFNAGIDQLNQQQATTKNKTEKREKDKEVRRFQIATIDAPLSQKQRKYRKKGYESQADRTSESTGSS